jgi:hypothetical protein
MFTLLNSKDISQQKYNYQISLFFPYLYLLTVTNFDGIVKSTNHVILNSLSRPVGKVRMKNLSQLSTRFFPDESGLPQNGNFGSFYETVNFNTKKPTISVS